jgi:alpha-beta hydrolase superfamily lysophospholipase
MYGHTKESWAPLTSVLNDRGITTLAIDLRGHGESRYSPDGSDDRTKVENRDTDFFNTMHLDAQAALEHLENNEHIKAQKIALVGASVGCSIAIRTAIDHPVAGVVVMTPGKEYLGIPTVEHIKKWPGIPLLIMTSEEEAERGAEDIYAALQNKGAKLMVFQEEGIHGTNMFGEVDNIEQTIADWLIGVLHQ